MTAQQIEKKANIVFQRLVGKIQSETQSLTDVLQAELNRALSALVVEVTKEQVSEEKVKEKKE